MKYYAIKSGKLKHIIKRSFVIVLFCFSFFSYAQVTLIPDSQFEQYLIDHSVDSDGVINGQILNSDIFNLAILDIIGYDISNFEGLQFFHSLTDFTLINNQAVTISTLDFSNNLLLTDISIINTPNLQQVGVNENINLINLTVVTRGELFNSIDVSANINLLSLEVADNALLNIDLANNINLTYLGVAINPMVTIDVSNLTELQNLATYESEINILDVSANPNLSSLNSDDGALTVVNLKSGFNNILTSVELNGNPNLSCILVDDATYSETATDWFKDNSANYIDNLITTEAQDIPLQYDSAGNYKIDIDEWLANNGGAVATSNCGEITWSYNVFEFFIQSSTNSIVYGVQFLATDIFGNTDSTVLDLTVENINHFSDEIYGSGDTICEDIFDLNSVVTDIDITADLNALDILSRSFTRISGPLGETFNGTIVDFPDTGAGSFSYLYKVTVEKSVSVYNPNSGDFDESIIEEEANITINNKTVALETQELVDITQCPDAIISSIQDLSDLVIFNNYNEVINPFIDRNLYWTPSIYDGSGTYTFNPAEAFPGCPSNEVSITIAETQELFAGDDVFADDDNSYSCGDTVSFNLNSFLDATADSGGVWRNSNNLVIAGGIVDFPDTGAGNFTKSFSYRQENNDCGFFSEADYDIAYEVEGFNVGTSTTIECQTAPIAEQDLLSALGAEGGGFWNPIIDSDNVGGGLYVYSHGDCGTGGDSTIEIIESTLSIDTEAQDESSSFYVSGSQPTNLDLDAFNNWINSNGGAVATTDCGNIIWTHSYDVSYNDIENTVAYVTTFIASDDVEDVNTIAMFTFNNVFVNAGMDFIFQSEAGIDGGTRCGNDDFSLGIIQGFFIQYDETATFEFVQTEGPSGTSFNGAIVDFPDTGAGQFLFSFDFMRNLDVQFPGILVELSDEAIVTFWVVVPFDIGEDGTLVVCEAQNVTLDDLYDALEGTPNIEGSNFEMEDLWTPSVYQGPGEYVFDFSQVAPSCSFGSSTVTVTEETPLSAGENGMLEIPEGTIVTAIQLFDALLGNPNSGGSWLPELAGENTYTYTQNATTSCPVSTSEVVVTESTLSIVDNEFNNLSIYPNPTTSKVTINGDISQLTRIQIYSISGQLLLELDDNFNEIDISSFDAAIYFMKLNSESKSKIIKIIKK